MEFFHGPQVFEDELKHDGLNVSGEDETFYQCSLNVERKCKKPFVVVVVIIIIIIVIIIIINILSLLLLSSLLSI